MPSEIEQLQERVAHLERMVEELSDMVADRGRETDVLTRRVEMLLRREAEREAGEGSGIPLADQRPPHW
jgi:SlyX protein